MKLPLVLVLMVSALMLVGGCQKKATAVDAGPEPMGSYQDPTFGGPVDAGITSAPPQPIEPAPVPAEPTIAGRTYTVQHGDTLWNIAARHYGNGQRYRDIAAANGIVEPYRLNAGQTIVLP